MDASKVTAAVSPRWRKVAWLRRTVLALLVLGQSLVGAYYMIVVLPYHGQNLLEKALLILFTILFMWISVGFWVGVYGFFVRCFGGDRWSLLRRHKPDELQHTLLARTAIIMPIYHEPVERSLGGLRAIYRSVQRTGQLEHFDFFILSDSRDPEVWLQEQYIWQQLVQELGAHGRLFYRRRNLNLDYKSGNVGDFLRRWGQHYDYAVVLDADSLMSGDTLVTMVRLMQLEPQIGILQSNPTLINGQSIFARAQQFANQAYGPLFSSGLAALQLGEATFWGHNAIIRVQPFMRHCGLPHLKGPGLFNGAISSHDFVEAAYMGRAGYEVWLEPGLQHSYEESPPTLVDDLTRDRRWAKGNLQHIWLMLFEPGLRAAHRMAFLNGIMSYLASPLWFAFLALTTVEASQIVLTPNYFPEAHSPFPLWPEWHPEWAVGLAGSTLFLLFAPKLLAIPDALFKGRRRDHGGLFAMTFSVIAESLVSALLAPIRMLAHTRFVLESLLNLRLRWAGQNRNKETSWPDAILSQAPGTLLGTGWAIFAWWLKPMFFYWSLPVALPLVLAAPVSVLLGRLGLGLKLKRIGLFRVAEERRQPDILLELQAGDQARSSPMKTESALLRALFDPVANRLHQALGRSHNGGCKQVRIEELRQRFYDKGPGSLEQKELAVLLKDRESLAWLHREVWQAEPNTIWGKLLAQRPRQNNFRQHGPAQSTSDNTS